MALGGSDALAVNGQLTVSQLVWISPCSRTPVANLWVTHLWVAPSAATTDHSSAHRGMPGA